ncbi:DUF6221 family protein [Streptomyces caniscabiei]|uniref:DUF6221 family protein n=1 Tax=Streptomyces caniscabiei TaxID=2746961 RepID=UPI000765F650|nr:DUF6221 family protein [Streptomyces caniscabiei]
MPDLHGWITQQLDEVESITRLISAGGYEPDEWRIEPSRSGRWAQIVIYSRTLGEPPEAASREVPVALVQTGRNEHLMMAMHDPARVLRRCEADRRVLARHRLNPDAYWAEAAMCEGCGTEGEMGYPRTENLNDCPELLDLAHAHGLTPEILAGLDRPQNGERPDYPGQTGNLIPDSIASLYARMHAEVDAAVDRMLLTGDSSGPTIGFRIVDAPSEPSPMDRALALLDPHLKKIPGYIPITNPET